MATPITQMPKPDAGQYSGERKLFLVPSFMMTPTLPDNGQALLDGYWSEVRDHVASLSRSLRQVSRVYHELVYEGGDAGIEMVEQVNPRGGSFIKSLCQAGAELEGLDDWPRWQANQHVGTLSFVQSLGHSREPKTLTQQPGQYVVDDAFVASVSVSWSCHAEYASTDVRGNQRPSALCIDHLRRRSPSVGPVDTTSIRRHAVGAGLKPALPGLPINSSFPSLRPRSRGA